MNQEIRNLKRSTTSSLILLILAPVLLGAGLVAQQMSLSALRNMSP